MVQSVEFIHMTAAKLTYSVTRKCHYLGKFKSELSYQRDDSFSMIKLSCVLHVLHVGHRDMSVLQHGKYINKGLDDSASGQCLNHIQYAKEHRTVT